MTDLHLVVGGLLTRDALPKTSTDKIDYQRLMRDEAG